MKYLIIVIPFLILTACNNSVNSDKISSVKNSINETDYEFKNGFPSDETANKLIQDLRFHPIYGHSLQF